MDQTPHYIFSKDPAYCSNSGVTVCPGLGIVLYRMPSKALANILIEMYYDEYPERPFDLEAVPATEFELRDYLEIDMQIALVEGIPPEGETEYELYNPKLIAASICYRHLDDLQGLIEYGLTLAERDAPGYSSRLESDKNPNTGKADTKERLTPLQEKIYKAHQESVEKIGKPPS